MRYSESFKAKMVQKMAGPSGRSAASLAEEVGVAQSTLSRWLLQAATVPRVSNKKGKQRGAGASKRPQDWSAEEKLKVVVEASGLSDEELGEFLRRNGLHEAQLEAWREQVTEALAPRRSRSKTSPEKRRIRELEKELQRKEKALAEAAALLVLKKKAQAIWGDEDDDMDPRSGK
jgi:transposase-like protein